MRQDIYSYIANNRAFTRAYRQRYPVLVILAGLLILAVANFSDRRAQVAAQGGPALTEAQMARLLPENLPDFQGLPALPLYSIEAAAFKAALNPAVGPVGPAADRVGIQVGHWRSPELPPELAALRGSQGSRTAGAVEVEVNLAIARRLSAALLQKNIQSDILPATVPPGYRAGAFVALHCDWSSRATASGLKVARSRYSLIPAQDDRLLQLLYASYGQATGLAPEWNLTRNMTGYYAFNRSLFQSSVAAQTPSVIIEMGFLTNQHDSLILLTQPDNVAQGIASGLETFLAEQASQPAAPANRHVPVLTVNSLGNRPVAVLAATGNDAAPVAYVAAGQQFAYFEPQAEYYLIWLPVLNRFGRVSAAASQVSAG